MRDYSKPLTIVLTGDGTSAAKNTEVLLEDYIFGSMDQVDVKLIVPFDGTIGASLDTAINILKGWGIDGADFIPIVEPNCGHKQIASAENTVQADQGSSMAKAIDLLVQAQAAGHDTTFLSIYNPDSTKDLAAITDAKVAELTTLNITLGLVDTFAGYESEADRVAREAMQEAYAEQQAAKEAAEKPARKTAAKKTAAKKATTLRKTAVSKALVSEDVPLTDEPEKPAQAVSQGWGPHEHKFVWADDNNGHSGSFCACGEEEPAKVQTGTERLVAQAVAREAEKKAARLELSGTIVAGKSELPKDLEPAKAVAPTVDVWQDIAQAAQPDGMILVRKDDVVELGLAMKKMADGFSSALDVYNRMVTGE